MKKLCLIFALFLLLTGCGQGEQPPASGRGQVASSSQMAPVEEVVDPDMVPIPGSSLKDGTYPIAVDSSSSMFKIEGCELTVENGQMTAVLHMGGTGYLKVFMGTGEQAAQATDTDCISFEEGPDGAHTYTVPVEGLDMGIPCAAFSKNKELWYDRTLVFRADSLPLEAFQDGAYPTAASLGLPDGDYTVAVELGGGSGRASIQSPAALRVEGGQAVVTVVWGSSNYDYMRVGEEMFYPVQTEGNSTFELPVAVFDRKLPVYADTTAMSTPHEIEYTLRFDSKSIRRASELLYAEQFSIEPYNAGAQMITIGGTDRYLLVQQGAEVPSGIPQEVAVLQQPLGSIYLVATSAMDMFRELDSMDAVTLSGTDASGWYIQEAKRALEEGRMTYAGKYSAPDYELILDRRCDLAIESTMIYHSPEVKEQLERLGVPVLVERSSYESHPLGRVEWIKLYGALLGKEDEARDYFDGLLERLTPILEQESTGKTVAFFFITANGGVNVRCSGDYIAKAIGLAGGVYAFPDLTSEGSVQTTMNIQMEEFYQGARDADILIYNSAIDGELDTLDQLLEKSPVLKDFKAVQEGNVWCTGKNLFQESLGLGELMLDMHRVMTEENPELTYLHPLT